MHTIKNWTASRSGPAMTVTGEDEGGKTIKLTGVQRIRLDGGRVVAMAGSNVYDLEVPR